MFKIILLILVGGLLILVFFLLHEEKANYTQDILQIFPTTSGIVVTPMNEKSEVYTRGGYVVSKNTVSIEFYKKSRFITRLVDDLFGLNQTFGFKELEVPLLPGEYDIFYENQNKTKIFLKRVRVSQ